MQSYQITSTKDFMGALLAKDTFNDFLLSELTLCTMNTFTIDGHINRDFFPADEQTEENIPYKFRCWSEIKAFCYELIKGKYTPTLFKIVLYLKPELAQSIMKNNISEMTLSQLEALVLNIKYENGKVSLTTATAHKTFTMDKDPDKLWDKYISDFLEKSSIPFSFLV